ncbi:MAG: S-layer homology domain-containing protein [Anaerotignum sp.]|nr:S-layer homology domain-containing protein [Anaerotignum sp.]
MVKTNKNRFFAIFLAVIMALGMIPAMGITVRAENKTYEFGSSKVELSAGTYDMNVSLMKASDPTSPSMAGSAIAGTAKLTVSDEGVATLEIPIGAVSVGPITGHASQWKIFTGTSASGDSIVATETKDSEGYVNSISYQIPDIALDGNYCEMYVDAMNTTTSAYLAYDYANIQTESPDPVLENGDYTLSVTAITASSYGTAEEKTFPLTRQFDPKIKLSKTDAGMKVSLLYKPSSIDMQKLAMDDVEGVKTEFGQDESGTAYEFTMDIANITADHKLSFTYNTGDGGVMTSSVYLRDYATSPWNGYDWKPAEDPKPEKSAAPSISPNGGTFTGSQSVTITAASGADIFYTLDGTNPTENSTKYTNVITLSDTTTVKAIAVEENKTASDVASATFTKTSSSSGGGGGGGGGGGSTQNFFLTDGRYLVDVALWNASTDNASMGNSALTNNDKALVTVSNGKVTTVEIATNPVQVGTVHSAITAMKYANSQEVKDSNSLSNVNVLETGDITTSGHTTSGTYKYIKRASFTLPSAAQPTSASDVTYVAVNFTVPDTPMDEVVAGSGKGLEARLKLTWSTAEKTTKSSLSANDEVARGTSSTTGQTVKDIALTDSATKIKLNADTEALPENTKLSVKKVTSGTAFESAQKAMENETKPWELYEIKATSDNADVQPKGQVQLSIPCTDAGLTVYRINDNGTRVAIKGEVKDGAYVFRTSALGNFAVMSNAEDGPIVPIVTENTADNTGNKADSLKDIVGHWAEKNIKKVVEKGLFSGTSETKFSPNKEMTRGMFITVLGRLHGVTGYSGETKFKDVKAGKYYAPYINWGNANGIVSGLSADEFAPDAPITRQEMATFLVRYAKFANIELNSGEPVSFKDAGSIATWAKDAVNAVSAAKLISGYPDGTFGPTGKATRAEVATLLINFVESYGL